jgi:dipeptidase
MVPGISSFGGVDLYGSSTDKFDENTLWWNGEEIHRRVLMNYPVLMPKLREYRDPVEKSMVVDIEQKWQANPDAAFQKICYEHADKLIVEQGKLAVKIKAEYEKICRAKRVPWWFSIQWKKNNSKAGVSI